MMKFYRLIAPPNLPSRWYLKGPVDSSGNELDEREFTQCKKFTEDLDLCIPLRRVGEVVDFNFADFDMPVCVRQINEALQKFAPAGIQRIPVTVGGVAGRFEILNVLEEV